MPTNSKIGESFNDSKELLFFIVLQNQYFSEKTKVFIVEKTFANTVD